MAWEIQKVGESIKKNPVPFLIGGGIVVLLAALVVGKKRTSGETEPGYYPEMTTPQGYSQGDLSQMTAELLYGFADIAAQQQEQFAEGLSEIQAGQVSLFGSLYEQQADFQETQLGFFEQLFQQQTDMQTAMQESIISLSQDQQNLFSSQQDFFDELISKTISGQQEQLKTITENLLYYKPASYSDSPSTSSSSSYSSGGGGGGGGGYSYVDKYGFSHVVASKETAEQYAAPGTAISYYEGSYSGGYARDDDGNRVSLGGVPYGN